ncbi:MAG TPA: VOC family protein [Terriglobales bacterium]|nr:VOC family protein [Terriglobales bacterium]
MNSTIIPALRYRDAKAAIEWLCRVFGFEQKAVYAGPGASIAHAELTLGGGMIMLGSQMDDEYGRGFASPLELGRETRTAYIVVADIDAVHARAIEAGAEILRKLQNTDYGSREFRVKDPEGHTWSVGTYNPWAPPK